MGILRIITVITGTVSTGTGDVSGTLVFHIVGVTTLGVHPGDKSLLTSDIIASVLSTVGVDSPLYTCHTSHIITLSTSSLSASHSTTGSRHDLKFADTS